MQDLPFHTPTQFVALALTLIAGWFLGLATSSGGRKWRERYRELELRHSKHREEAELELRDAKERIRELEAENARLAADPRAATAPVTAGEPVRVYDRAAPAHPGHVRDVEETPASVRDAPRRI